MQRIADVGRETSDPVEFLEALKLDLEQDEVYVFTPKGKVHCVAGPFYAGRLRLRHPHRGGAPLYRGPGEGASVPLDTVLSSADTVEIFTSKAAAAAPSRDWLQIVASPRARNKIRQWFSRERREDAIEKRPGRLGQRVAARGDAAAKGHGSSALVQVAASMKPGRRPKRSNARIGEHQVSAQSIVQRLSRELRGGEPEQLPTTATTGIRGTRSGRRSKAGVYVEGLDDVMVHLARCCTPVPGDEDHRLCDPGSRGVGAPGRLSNATALSARSQERLIEVEWDRGGEGVFPGHPRGAGLRSVRLLADVSRVVSEHHLNIVAARTATALDRVQPDGLRRGARPTPTTSISLIASLKHLDGVFDAYRQLPGKKG